MIDIRIDGQSVDLTPGTTLVLERFNPLLSFEQFQGNKVNGFDLPNTPLNRRILGYFYEDQVGYQNRRFRCEKYQYGQLVEQGYVYIASVKVTGYSLFYTQNLGEAFGDYQTVWLSQLGLSSEPVSPPVAAANHLTDRYCYPTILNSGFYGNQAVSGWNGMMNQFDSGNSTYNENARVPMPFLRWVFNQFTNLTGWSFKGQFWQDPDLARLILYNLFSLDGQTAINANNHLPDLTMPQLLVDLRKLFNLFVEFDIHQKVVTMDFADDVLSNAPVIDWTEKANPDHLKAPETINRLDLSYDLDSNDALLKPVPTALDRYLTAETTVNQGGTAQVIRSRISTLTTDVATGRAITQQTGFSPQNKDSKNALMPKILFWKGVQNSVPLATNAHGSRALIWNGENSLANGYQKFEAFKGDTFSVTKMVYLSPADLALFSFRKKIYIRGVNYIVGNMKAVLGFNQQIIPTEVTLWRL